MQTVTLNGDDFRTVHNTLCELRSMQERLTGVINDTLAGQLQTIIRGFEQGLADAYAQDDAVFDAKMNYYGEFKRDNSLQTIWSIFDLPMHGFLKQHPYPSDAFIVYKQHWGDNRDSHYPVQGTTWGDIYRAADQAIRASGDDHHIFIEDFELRNGNELHLTTGS